jgi:1,4-alpha-glucan branching enzyme
MTNTISANIIDDRHLANDMAKPVNFFFNAPRAQTVRLAGDFNQWNSAYHPLHRQVDGWWFIQVPLAHGHHRYWFLVDGKPMLDPRATGVDRNEKNEPVSLICVS